MKVYVGQARGQKLIRELEELGFGEMTTRGEYPPRRQPWAYDNGAFRDWKAGIPFKAQRFRAELERVAASNQRPDFIVVPDKVAGGMESLGVSNAWLPWLRAQIDAPLYLALQDGMTPAAIEADAYQFDGFFVGGTLGWKIKTGESWVTFAHRMGKNCHVGRVGTGRRVRWARRIRADSIDSSLPLWSKENMHYFVEALQETLHPSLFGSA